MDCQYAHQRFDAPSRVSQSLRNDRCQNILYKAVFEHFREARNIAALLLSSKSFQNSTFGANFIVNFVVDKDLILLINSVLSPSSCFSLQLVPSLHIRQSKHDSEELASEPVDRGISSFFGELVSTKYLRSSLQSLILDDVPNEVHAFFESSSSNAWPKLQRLSLDKCDVDDAVVEAISEKAAQLRSVNLAKNAGITDSCLEHVAKLSSITSLDLNSCFNVTDAGLVHVSKLSSITFLDVSWCVVTDAGLEHISTLSNIITLDLAGCNAITDAGLERISNLSRVTSLDLSYCANITDFGLANISTLSGITFLNLINCNRISDAGLEHLSKLSRITSLNLYNCNRITDVGLENMWKLSGIASLNLYNCNLISDTGLEHLSKLAGINFLNLTFCGRISDVGLEHIAKLSNLASLELLSCRSITFNAKKKLKDALPNCKIK